MNITKSKRLSLDITKEQLQILKECLTIGKIDTYISCIFRALKVYRLFLEQEKRGKIIFETNGQQEIIKIL